jgi:hypothetical protein
MDPLEEMQTMISDARGSFHAEVAEILHDAQKLANSLATAIGEVSPAIALDAWKREMRKRLSYEDPRRK